MLTFHQIRQMPFDGVTIYRATFPDGVAFEGPFCFNEDMTALRVGPFNSVEVVREWTHPCDMPDAIAPVMAEAQREETQ